MATRFNYYRILEQVVGFWFQIFAIDFLLGSSQDPLPVMVAVLPNFFEAN